LAVLGVELDLIALTFELCHYPFLFAFFLKMGSCFMPGLAWIEVLLFVLFPVAGITGAPAIVKGGGGLLNFQGLPDFCLLSSQSLCKAGDQIKGLVPFFIQ
jgi:hypothetical protein